MENSKKNCSCVRGVGCDVRNCKYHSASDNCCTAGHIDVQNKSAVVKAETFCGTFIPRGID